MQRIVVFGATSAIAHAASRLWVQRGDQLVLVGRNPDKLASAVADLRTRGGPQAVVHGLQADLDDLDAHPRLLAQAEQALGGLDVALIAHGTLPDNERCATDVGEAMKEIRTNALSVISLCTLIGERFAARGAGRLAVIGSVAGDRGRQSNYVYGAAKGMVALYLQGLRNRLSPQGVQVLTVKPGFVDTPMTDHLPKGGPLWATPERVAAGIVGALDRRRDVVYLPGFWRPVMALIRSIPEGVFKRMKL